MDLTRRTLLTTGLAGVVMMPSRLTFAQAAKTIRVGVIADMSGVYSDIAGAGSLACTQQAAAEFMAQNPGINVEVLVADHQNKPDVGLSIVRRWFDEGGVDVIADVGNSALCLASRPVLEEKNKASIISTAASSLLTGKECSPNVVHWTHDSWSIPHSTATSPVRSGGDKWFFLTADYAYGHAAEADSTKFIEAAGGKVVGSVKFPLGTTGDFSSYLLRAQSSGANVLGLIAGGADLVSAVKQSREFGIDSSGMRTAILSGFITDMIALGIPVAQGLVLTETFYWDLNDRTRAFTNRVRPKMPKGAFPNMNHAGDYAGVLHYLKAVKELGVDKAKASGRDTVDMMKKLPTDDDAFGKGMIRVDGRKIHPAYLFQVKRPEEVKYDGDVFKLISTLSAEEAFRPLDQGGCPLVKA